jgi:hypothetical protein
MPQYVTLVSTMQTSYPFQLKAVLGKNGPPLTEKGRESHQPANLA